MEESIHFKVPLLAIPFFGDQQANVDSMVSKGLGLSLDHHNIQQSTFKAAIIEVITNEKYVRHIRLKSSTFQWRMFQIQGECG